MIFNFFFELLQLFIKDLSYDLFIIMFERTMLNAEYFIFLCLSVPLIPTNIFSNIQVSHIIFPNLIFMLCAIEFFAFKSLKEESFVNL